VEPAHAELAEKMLPVDIADLELAGRGVAPIGDADGAADAETFLGEVQSVANRAAHAIVGNPLHERHINAALQDQVFEQSPHVIVGKRADEAGAQPEATAQTARDVVFAAAFPDLELASRANA